MVETRDIIKQVIIFSDGGGGFPSSKTKKNEKKFLGGMSSAKIQKNLYKSISD